MCSLGKLLLCFQGAAEESYSGIADAFRKIYVNEGVTAFYKGALCRQA